MNSRIAMGLTLAIGLLACFAAGRFLPATKAAAPLAPEAQSSAKLAPGPRIAVPVDSVVKILRDPGIAVGGFDHLCLGLPRALVFLGIAEEDQQALIARFKDIEKRKLAEEPQRLKVIKVTDTEIVIDHSAMREPVKMLAVEAKEAVRTLLPADFAEVLMQSINWDYFDMYETAEPVSTFRIVRSSSRLMAKRSYPKGGSTMKPLKRNKYPDDGTAIPVREAFDEARWASLLGDHKLLPVDDPEDPSAKLRAPAQRLDNK